MRNLHNLKSKTSSNKEQNQKTKQFKRKTHYVTFLPQLKASENLQKRTKSFLNKLRKCSILTIHKKKMITSKSTEAMKNNSCRKKKKKTNKTKVCRLLLTK